MRICLTSLRVQVFLACFWVILDANGMTNSISLKSLLDMRWSEFDGTQAFGLLKPVLQTQVVASNIDKQSNRSEIIYSLFKTDLSWLSLIRIAENNHDGQISVVLDFNKIPESEGMFPVVLPFELANAKFLKTFIDLFYLPEYVTCYPNNGRLLTFTYPASASMSIYTKPMRPDLVDGMIVNSMPDIRGKKSRASWMNEYQALYRLEMPKNFQDMEHDLAGIKQTSSFHPCEMFGSMIKTNSITIEGKLFPLEIERQVQISEYSEAGLLTNIVVLSRYKIKGYPSICTIRTSNGSEKNRELIYQVEFDLESYGKHDYKNYGVPNLRSYCEKPLNGSGNMCDAALMVRTEGSGWDMVFECEKDTFVWCTYGRLALDKEVAVLRSLRFCKSKMLSRKYSALQFNPLISCMVDGFELFYYW